MAQCSILYRYQSFDLLCIKQPVITGLKWVDKLILQINWLVSLVLHGSRYSRMSQVKFLKAVFHKFYLVRSWKFVISLFISQDRTSKDILQSIHITRPDVQRHFAEYSYHKTRRPRTFCKVFISQDQTSKDILQSIHITRPDVQGHSAEQVLKNHALVVNFLEKKRFS